jgi:hypothetical protein
VNIGRSRPGTRRSCGTIASTTKHPGFQVGGRVGEDCYLVVLAGDVHDRIRRQVDMGEGSAGVQRQRHPAGAGRELQHRAVVRQPGEQIDHGAEKGRLEPSPVGLIVDLGYLPAPGDRSHKRQPLANPCPPTGFSLVPSQAQPRTAAASRPAPRCRRAGTRGVRRHSPGTARGVATAGQVRPRGGRGPGRLVPSVRRAGMIRRKEGGDDDRSL